MSYNSLRCCGMMILMCTNAAKCPLVKETEVDVKNVNFGSKGIPLAKYRYRSEEKKKNVMKEKKIGYTSRFVRVILAQGLC